MANYESVLIARQDLGASQVSNIVSDLSDIIKKEGGEVVRVDNWGLKNLAYRIKKNRKGHYVVMNIAAPANAIAEFERIMRFNEDIIRYMTVKVDEFSEDSSASNDKDSVEEGCRQYRPCGKQHGKDGCFDYKNGNRKFTFFQ